jgi:predicted SAM-dependent methyltransferase
MIFAEHFFEHLERPLETGRFLSECLRVLEPGGVVRLVVPDAGLYLRLYAEPDWHGLVVTRPLRKQDDGYLDTWLNQTYATKMEMINAVFRQSGEHKFAYDAETLIATLREARFDKVIHQPFGVSASGQAPDSEKRRSESLYVEGIKCQRCRE